MDRLARTRLLFGDDGVAKLQNATVMVVGCGAVGSFATEALARTGIGHLIVVDFDTVAPSNINRQLIATSENIGMPKVDATIARVRQISPDICVDAFNMFWDADSDLPMRPDFIIDAIDSLDSKIALYAWAQKNKIPFAASMGAARKTRPDKIRIGKLYQTSVCPLAARVRKLARAETIDDFDVVYSTETPAPITGENLREFGSVITITGTFGLFLANIAIEHILKLR